MLLRMLHNAVGTVSGNGSATGRGSGSGSGNVWQLQMLGDSAQELPLKEHRGGVRGLAQSQSL